ncbi:MAG: tRNA (adenosine(37)-N6)-threonylcarbamoyltransferase complex ATPase subunit type 1 TsaE [Phycisphaeraceae bacterium]
MTEHAAQIAIDTFSIDETARVGRAIGRCCGAGDVVALQGELGSGKTQLVRGLAEGMGLDPGQVSSPTFVMAQEYEPPSEKGFEKGVRPLLVHIDAYRIGSAEELESIGWIGCGEELRENAVVAIEWARLIRPALGEDLLWVAIEHAANGRRITLSPEGDWSDKMPKLATALHAFNPTACDE